MTMKGNEMTMTMETTQTTQRAMTFDRDVLLSLNSLAAFTGDKDDPQVIQGIKIVKSGDDEITAYATNRYVLVRARYRNVAFLEWHDDTPLWLDPVALKQAAAFAKTHKYAVLVSIGYNTDDEDTFIGVLGNVYTYRQATQTYPKVETLFSDEEPTGVPQVSLNPKWFALLTKLVMPESKPLRDFPWDFSFFDKGESRLPKPVLAATHGMNYDMSVLIQPNVKTR